MTLSERFAQVFRGRIDCYGSWDGRCIKEPVTPELYEKHLTSDDPKDWIGIYPMGKNLCSWGCIDIDGADFPSTAVWKKEGEVGFYETLAHPDYHRKDPKWHDWDAMLNLAADLCTVLAVKGIEGHVEKTRNGYHVWVFPEDRLVNASTMRRALMAACTAIDYKPNEVNPKQEQLAGDKVGNYVRLPYYGALTPNADFDPADRYFIVEDYKCDLEEFLDMYITTPTSALEACAALWKPKTTTWTVDAEAGLEVQPILYRLNALGNTIWRDGPLPGSDRSSTLAHLCHLCQESGLTPDEAFSIIRSADERHGRKFADREDGAERIAEMVERAYAT